MFASPIFQTVILLLTFVVIFLIFIFMGLANNAFAIIVTIYGDFVATVIGVYWSIYLTNIKAHEDDQKNREAILLGSLKLLYSELDINEMNLESVAEALRVMPLKITEFFGNFTLLEPVILGLKTQAFYGVISSGDMREITTEVDIFNPIQQAYFNMDLFKSGFVTAKIIFKEFKNDTPYITVYERNQCLSTLNNVKENIDKILKIIKIAKGTTAQFLIKKGTKISVDKVIKSLVSN